MPVTIETRYKLALDQLQFASNIRFKILAAWGAVYVAMGTVFVWVQSDANLKEESWLIPLITIGLTVLLWAFDRRNGSAIGAAKDVGEAIEKDEDSDIPEGQRYFSLLKKDDKEKKKDDKEKKKDDKKRGVIPHGKVIKIFSISMIILLSAATIFLFYNRV